ncbi:MAG: citryl-CoA lyase [Candidatus Zixiibacteriota bacterium]
MSELNWSSAISEIAPNVIRLRGYPVEELMGRVGFAEAIHLALIGELPDSGTATLLDAIFVSSLDHGTTPPSVHSALTVASAGAPLGSAAAAGILAISRWHGGDIEDCMRTIQEALGIAKKNGISFSEAAMRVVDEYKARNRRISGFGHRLHSRDPRTTRLLQMADQLGKSQDGVDMACWLEDAIAQSTGKPIPLNVDGAIAAILVDLRIPVELANGFFMIARLPGLLAHAHEETTRQNPMRVIHPLDVTYDGPPLRHLA